MHTVISCVDRVKIDVTLPPNEWPHEVKMKIKMV